MRDCDHLLKYNILIKLRKHIRTRRLTNVRQLGVDRIIDFEFAGVGEGTTYHIIAEFYASVIYRHFS